MIRIYKQLFFSTRFFVCASVIVVIFALSFVAPWLFKIGQLSLILLVSCTIADSFLLIDKKRKLTVRRIVPNIISLGDENQITIHVKNTTGLKIKIVIYDNLPYQLQNRDFKIESGLSKNEEKTFEYYS